VRALTGLSACRIKDGYGHARSCTDVARNDVRLPVAGSASGTARTSSYASDSSRSTLQSAFCNRDGFSWDLPNESPEIVNVEAPGDG
jgi:hypothetical protein